MQSGYTPGSWVTGETVRPDHVPPLHLDLCTSSVCLGDCAGISKQESKITSYDILESRKTSHRSGCI